MRAGLLALVLALLAPHGVSQTNGPQWVERPAGPDFEKHYPERALIEEVEGRAMLACTVLETGRLECVVESEDPVEYGFGEAAIAISHAFRMPPVTREGVSTAGGRVRVPIAFRLGD